MSFDAQQRKMNDILSEDVMYVIPRYQRRYVWQEKQWRELLDDIKYCLEAEGKQDKDTVGWTHFLGSFVFERYEHQGKESIVIDGQQRLTTITLMLCAICTLLNEMGEEARFRGVTKYIIGTNDMGEDYIRVNNQDLDNYKIIVADTTEYQRAETNGKLLSGSSLKNSPQDNVNVKQCYYFFYQQFQEMIGNSAQRVTELIRIKDKIMSLDVIDIRASNQRESFNIFEILNARGVELQQHELIKNYIFKYIRPIAQVDVAKITWDDIEKTLYIDKRQAMNNFFSHYVSHRFEKPSKDNSEFRIIKQYSDRECMKELLDDISEKAKYYRMFYYPEEYNNPIISEVLQFFLINNHRQFRPLFLSAMSAYQNGKITEKEAEQFFLAIRNFYFGYGVVLGGKSNTIEDMVYQYARKIENENAKEAIKELKIKLQQYYPDYKTFEAHFVLMGWSHSVKSYHTPSKKKEVQYILSGIEEYNLSHNAELTIKNFTLEHIANDNGAESHCRIGNILMLAEPINGNAAQKEYVEKLPYYEKSNFVSTQNFVKRYGMLPSWGDDEIAKRAKAMANLAYNKIWKFCVD